MTGEFGAPLSAFIEIDFAPPAGVLPFVFAGSDASGFYRRDFAPVRPLGNLPTASGTIIVWARGYQDYQQVLPWGVAEFVRDVPMRPLRTIRTGQTLELTIEHENSICSDQEDYFQPAYRCEQFVVDNPSAGTLLVEAHATNGSAVAPFVFTATSGWYHRQVQAPGTVSIQQVQAGKSYYLYVGVKATDAPQSYVVSTSLQAGTVDHRQPVR